MVRLGLRSLGQHKLRSALSILGVVFGVAAVVAMSSVGEGARREALAQVGALGIDSVTLKTRPPEAGLPAPPLTLREADLVREVVPGLLAVAPLREAALPAEAGSRRTGATALGTTPAYARAARLRVASGRFLADLDLADRKRVAVLGAAVAAALFPFGDPAGQPIRLGLDYFTVVGVLEERASSKAGRTGPIRTRDVNRAVFVPLPALDQLPGPPPAPGRPSALAGRADGVDEIVLRVSDAEAVTATAEVVRTVVRRATGRMDLELVVPREILRQKEHTQRIFNVVTGAVAALGLLVGGIGIMNIMLASVAERTREVGVRRAVGASRRDVAAQFLVESSLLTAAGGALGAVLGVLGSVLIQQLAGWPTALSLAMLAAALLVALAVGVGFGFYPAWKAAHLEPMEALRQ